MSADNNRLSTRQSFRAMDQLKAHIRMLEGAGVADGVRVPMGVPAIDEALEDGAGLATGCLHEVSGPSGDGASLAFTLWLASKIAKDEMVLWVGCGAPPYPPGMGEFGLDPAKLIHIQPRKPANIAWVLEEAARTGAAPVVVGDFGLAQKGLDLTASRRLQLACEPFSTTLLLLITGTQAAVGSAAVSRWRIESLSSRGSAHPLPMNRWGIGRPTWQASLIRARGGRPGSWPLVWQGREKGIAPLPAAYPMGVPAPMEARAANAA